MKALRLTIESNMTVKALIYEKDMKKKTVKVIGRFYTNQLGNYMNNHRVAILNRHSDLTHIYANDTFINPAPMTPWEGAVSMMNVENMIRNTPISQAA